MAAQPVSPRVRWFVRTVLALFVICGLARIEAWPLTGWRLFSHVRKPVQTSWRAVVVSSTGTESGMGFADAAYRGTPHVLDGFPSSTAAQRDAVCSVWLAELRREGRDVASIHIERVIVDHSRRDGRRRAPGFVARDPRYECRDGRVRTLS